MKRNQGGGRRLVGESLEGRRCLTANFATVEIDAAAGDITAIAAADFDGDGDNDVVVATREQGIAWYANLNGRGMFGSRQVISSTSDGYAVWIAAEDLDGDGDADVVAASLQTQELFWFENLDGSNGFSAKRVATPTLIGGISVELSDLDGDGDLDLLWGSVFQNAVVWNANNGDGTFGGPRLIAAGLPSVQDAVAADVNGDGRDDVVVASLDFLDPRVAWFENLGGGRFSSERVVVAGEGVWAIDAGDMDGDGDLDLVTAVYNNFDLKWLENRDAAGDFGPLHDLASAADSGRFPMDVEFTDLDGNGQLDVVAVPLVGSGVPAWIANPNGEATVPLGLPAAGANRFAMADVDGDGTEDVILDADDVLLWTKPASQQRIIGDSNGDGVFDSSDFVTVFVAGLYETGRSATFEQGDWNGDGVFSSADLVTAFVAGGYVGNGANARAVELLIKDSRSDVVDSNRATTVDEVVRRVDVGEASGVLASAVDWLLHDERTTRRW